MLYEVITELQAGKKFGLIGFGGGLSACFAFGTIRSALQAWTNQL